MPILILCRERLCRIHAILARHPHGVSVREFGRTFGVHRWELEQAEGLGFVQIRTRLPRTGRPAYIVSRVARDVSEKLSAKPLPSRCDLPKPITVRTFLFAVGCTETEPCERSAFGFQMTPHFKAWMNASPRARSKDGARASASRKFRKRDTIAVMQWTFAQRNREIPATEIMPVTAAEIWLKLKELGSWRATEGWKPPSGEVEAIRAANSPRRCVMLEKLCGLL